MRQSRGSGTYEDRLYELAIGHAQLTQFVRDHVDAYETGRRESNEAARAKSDHAFEWFKLLASAVLGALAAHWLK